VVVGARRHQDEVPSKRVSLNDLDLSTQVGACTALKRIRHAADYVCPYEGERPLYLWRAHNECLQDAVNRAVQDTHSKRIERLYASRSGGC
jgi:UrcA family protein